MKIFHVYLLVALCLIFTLQCHQPEPDQTLRIMSFNIRLDLDSDGINAWPEGDYTHVYEGTGRFSFNGNLYEKTAEPGKIILGFNKPGPGEDGMFELGIVASDSLDPIKNIRIHLPEFDETQADINFNPEFQQSGHHEIHLNGEGLASGVYLCQLRAGHEKLSRRLICIR